MAVSRKSGRTVSTSTFLTLLDGLSRYDLVLAVVPLGFALSLLAHVLVGLSVQVAVLSGSVIGMLALADALFVHPPSADPPEESP